MYFQEQMLERIAFEVTYSDNDGFSERSTVYTTEAAVIVARTQTTINTGAHSRATS